jgi:type IV secretory pathway TraG/TraD family ATPase VirD4
VVELHRRSGPRWNPLMEIRQGDDFESDCRRMAEILSDREGGRREHWDDAGVNYLTGVIAHVLLSGNDKTLRGVRAHVLRRDAGAKEMVEHGAHQMVRDAGAAVFKHASAKEAEDGGEKKEGWSEKNYVGRNAATGKRVDRSGRDLDGDSDKEQEKKSGYRDSIYSTCETHLALIESTVLADQTAVSDFRFSDLMAMEKPMTLLLSCRPRDLKNWRKIYKLFMVMMIDSLTDDEDFTADGRKKLHDALIAIDEFLQFNFQEIGEWICYVRSFRLRLLLLAQGMGSIKEQCPSSIVENCIRLVFRPRAPEEAMLIETMMGKEDIESPTKTISRGNPLNWETISEGVRIDQRPRHSTMDVLTMPRSVVFVVGLPHLYLLQAPRPWLDQPWATYWTERVGPSTTPWTPTPGATPWMLRKPTSNQPAPRAPSPRVKSGRQREMPI